MKALPLESRTSFARSETRAPGTSTLLGRWHLLSLDAPTVATAWMLLAARTSHARLQPALPVAMFVAVWMVYALDRLLDARHAVSEQLAPRHHFHRRHAKRFRVMLVVAAIFLVGLILHFTAREIEAYGVLASLLAAWFVLVHFASRAALPRVLKETVTAVIFAAALFLPCVLASGAATCLVPAASFAALALGNLLLITAWEERESDTLARALLWPLLIGTGLLPILHPEARTWAAIFSSVALASAALLLLNRLHGRFADTTLRAAADAALLTPLLVLPFLR